MIYLVSYGKEGVSITIEGLLNEVNPEQIRGSFETCDEAKDFMLMSYDYALILTEDNKYEVKESNTVTDEIVLRAFTSKKQAEEYIVKHNKLAAEIANLIRE